MKTKLIRSIYNIRELQQGGVVTIGNFDGVHRGHQKLLEAAIMAAKARRVPSTVLTFEPHAFEFFSPHKVTIPRLTRMREKYTAIADAGIDNVLILPFNQLIASLPASAFVEQLHGYLKPCHLVIGDDFHFGKGREGNFNLLQVMGRELGFTVESISSCLHNGRRVSSTWVREALAEGDHKLASELLGRPYSMMGRVRLGDQLGRQLGFPTANIFLHRKLTPVLGIYTVYMLGIDEKPLPGVANVGTRPTVDGTRTLLEVHLLDFDKDIYGRYVKVEFCKKLRDEERYPNLEMLREAIEKDVAVGRNYFKKMNK